MPSAFGSFPRHPADSTLEDEDGRTMEREIYDEDHEAFRDVVKEFLKRFATEEKRKQWEADGEIDRATMLAAGEAGIIGLSVPEEFGGAGMLQDYRFRSIVLEETIGAGRARWPVPSASRTTSPCRTSCTWARRSRRRSGCPAWRPARSSARSR
jgi:alkylation response protein AidB-like acyl-CoA dehydrogenase